MIEPIMYFGIGFLFASLIGLVLIPLVHNRAERLTIKRIEASTPVSMTEIQADKDLLRAEFAMTTRRLEMSVDQLRARNTSQLADLGKKTEAISRLKGELGEKSAVILALESREKLLRDQMRALEEELAVKTGLMHEAARGLSEKEAKLAKMMADLGDRSYATDTQRVEIAALRTQVGALKTQIDHFEADVKAAESNLGQVRGDADSAAAQIAAERSKAETLGQRLVQLERQLLVQTTESETQAKRAQDLEAQLTIQGRMLAERDAQYAERARLLAARENEANQLRSELDAAKKLEAELRAQIAALEEDTTAVAASGTGSALEQELKHTREQNAALERDVASAKRAGDGGPEAERAENALLRERIADIAAEVARLTMALEGPQSPIEAMLADHARTPDAVNGNGAHDKPPADTPGPSSLADRIRALRTRVARAASPV